MVGPRMNVPDLVVGSLAAMLGLAMLAAAITDSAWLTRLPKSRLLVDAVGKTAARVIIALAGAVLIGLAGLVASGWRIHWG
jgi:hypothetical protein